MALRSLLQSLKKKITETGTDIGNQFNPSYNNGNNFWSGKGGQALSEFQLNNPLSIFSQTGRDYRQQQAKYLQSAPPTVPMAPVYKSVGRFAEQFNTSAGRGITQAQSGLKQAYTGGKQVFGGDYLKGAGNIGQGLLKITMGGGQLLAQTNPWVYGSKAVASLPGTEKLNVNILGNNVNIPQVGASMIEFAKNPVWKGIFPQTSKLMSAFGNSKTANLLLGSLSKGGIEGVIMGLADMPEGMKDQEKVKYMLGQIGWGMGSELAFNSAGRIKFLKTMNQDFKAYKDSFGGRTIGLPNGKRIDAWKYDLLQKFPQLKNRPGFARLDLGLTGDTQATKGGGGVKPMPGFTGKMDRTRAVWNKVASPELKGQQWEGHGNSAWTKGEYINDGLHTARKVTPQASYSYDDVNGLRQEGGPEHWQQIVDTAKRAAAGEERLFMDKETAKSFLKMNDISPTQATKGGVPEGGVTGEAKTAFDSIIARKPELNKPEVLTYAKKIAQLDGRTELKPADVYEAFQYVRPMENKIDVERLFSKTNGLEYQSRAKQVGVPVDESLFTLRDKIRGQYDKLDAESQKLIKLYTDRFLSSDSAEGNFRQLDIPQLTKLSEILDQTGKRPTIKSVVGVLQKEAKAREVPVSPQPEGGLPKIFEPLVSEAKKFNSADDFEQAIVNPKRGIDNPDRPKLLELESKSFKLFNDMKEKLGFDQGKVKIEQVYEELNKNPTYVSLKNQEKSLNRAMQAADDAKRTDFILNEVRRNFEGTPDQWKKMLEDMGVKDLRSLYKKLVSSSPQPEGGVKVYRGGTTNSKYFSTSKSVAQDFANNRGGSLSEYTLNPSAKIINYEDIPTAQYKGINDYNMEKYGSGKDLLSFQNGKLETDYIKAENWAKQNGYDAVKFPTEGEIRVINNKALSSPQPEGGVGVTKGIQMPQPETPVGKSAPSTKVLPNPLKPTTPTLEPQTNQTVSVRKQSTQPLDEIIQHGRNQIGKTAEKTNQPIKKTLDDLYTQWVDRYNPIVKASQQAKQTLKIKGAELRPEYDPEYLVRRLTGAGGIADYRFKTELNPILKQMEQLNIPKVDMDVYLANKRIAGFGQVGRDIYGTDPAKAGRIVNALEQKYGGIRQIADQMYQFQNKGFQEMIDAGFISPEAGQIIRQQNPDYSPLYRVMDEVDNYLGLPTRKTMQGSQPVIKIKGSTRQIESPVESMIGNIFKQRAAIEKNRVAKSIVGLQEIVPELGFKKVGAESYKTIKTPEGEFRKVLKPLGQLPDDTIIIWNKGKKEAWRVGKDIADVAKGVNEESMNMVLKILQAPAALLRQGATGRNPEFMIPNIIRDQLDAGVTSRYGYIPFVDYVSGLKSMLTNDDVYKKWQSSGAKIDLGELSGKKSISQLFDEKKASKGLFGWLSAGLDVMGQYSEQPTRVGLFKKAYNKTGNELLAAMESRDATVDFARMGSKMKVANSIVPFLNVGVQGFDKLIRSVKNNPGKVLLTLGVYAVAPQIASTVYNLTQHPEEYAEIPEYEKQSNFVLVKGRNENGTVDYVTIPKGNVVPVAANPVQSFLEFAFGQDKTSFSEMALNTLSEALPVLGQGSSLKEIGIKTIGANLPQAIKPLTENLLNKSFYKYDPNKEQTKEIVPYYLQKEPSYKQTYEFTPQMYQKIGAIFNVSPLQVQNLMEGYLAGYTKIPAQIIQSLYKISDNQEVSPNDKTILRRFIKQTYPSSSNGPEPKPETPGLMERLSGTASASDGKMYKYSDGTVKMQIGGKMKSFDSAEEAQLGLEKYKFKESGKSIQTQGDVVFRRSKDGDVTVTPKIDYETSIVTQKMQNAKKDGDYETWMSLAEKQYENYQTQLQDPSLDELEKMELQQKIDTLITDAEKYQGYKGFTKPKKGAKITIKNAPKAKAIKITQPKIAPLKITAPNVIKRTKSQVPIVKITKPKLKSMKLKRGVKSGIT